MNHKRRLKNLEHQPTQRRSVFDESKARLLRMLERQQQEWRDDPEGCEARRLEGLRRLGFPEGYSPTPSEILQRVLERRTN